MTEPGRYRAFVRPWDYPAIGERYELYVSPDVPGYGFVRPILGVTQVDSLDDPALVRETVRDYVATLLELDDATRAALEIEVWVQLADAGRM